MSDKRTNVVVIIADQLRADHLGFAGKVPVRTPNIDRLASTGHNFTQAYVTNPVCMPNRASIMTGRWPSAHGLRTNGIPLDPAADTFARTLRNSGWRTSAVGKLHFQPMGWPFEEFQLDEIKEVMPALWKQAIDRFGGDFVSWEDYERHMAAEVILPGDYYGFDDVALTSGHGDRVSGNYVQWARERGLDPATDAGSGNSENVYAGWNQVYESAVPARLHPTTYVTENAVARLDEYAESEDPFLLYVSFPDPHHPFAPPTEYWNRHDPADVPVPETFFDKHGQSPDYIKRMLADQGTPHLDPTMTWAPTEEQFRHALAAELGSIEFIDDSVGKILEALERNGQLENTVIVFTADHGDVFGDHGLMLKHFTHYNGVIRVPLILVIPGADSGEHSDLVSSADIAPTIVELAGVAPMPAVQGSSLVPITQGQPGPHAALLIEEDQPFGIDGLPGPVRFRTIVTPQVRLTQISGQGVIEMYDRRTDPAELHNLVNSPAGADLRAEGTTAMLDEVVRLIDDSVVPFHAA
jgi:arylsulfatase A-like enzyme